MFYLEAVEFPTPNIVINSPTTHVHGTIQQGYIMEQPAWRNLV